MLSYGFVVTYILNTYLPLSLALAIDKDDCVSEFEGSSSAAFSNAKIASGILFNWRKLFPSLEYPKIIIIGNKL